MAVKGGNKTSLDQPFLQMCRLSLSCIIWTQSVRGKVTHSVLYVQRKLISLEAGRYCRDNTLWHQASQIVSLGPSIKGMAHHCNVFECLLSDIFQSKSFGGGERAHSACEIHFKLTNFCLYQQNGAKVLEAFQCVSFWSRWPMKMAENRTAQYCNVNAFISLCFLCTHSHGKSFAFTFCRASVMF